MDKFYLEFLVYLLSQVVYVYIYKVCSGIEVGIPDFFRYFYTADDPFRIFYHVYQQVVFFGGQFDGNILSPDLLKAEID